jgi:uncharacterized protein (TIGR02246 family)
MRALPVALLLLGLAAPGIAQEVPVPAPAPATVSPDALHDELRRLRDAVLAGIESGDFEAIAPHLHPDVVFTPMNNEVCRGPQEIRAYFDKMLKGPNPVVKSVRFDLEVDRLTDLYGDTGLAFGSSNDHYTLTNGMEFPVATRWTCALVRQDGRWLISAFHASANVFENPILEKSRQGAMLKWGGIGLIAGLALGALVASVLARRRRG